MKLQMRLPFYVSFFIAFCFHFLSFSQEIHFALVHAAREEGSGSVAQMAQDSQGFLWLATESGLYKYDGDHYTAYHYEPSNPNSPAAIYIRCVIVDKAGYVWLSPRLAGLDGLDPATGVFTHFRHNKNDPGVWVTTRCGQFCKTMKEIYGLERGAAWTGLIAQPINFFTTEVFQMIHHPLAAI